MELEKFKAGRLEKGAGYSYFVPQEINKQWVWSDPELNFLLEKASIKFLGN